jgi:glycosyltransferase involved in cell wall biosynthesis
LVGPSRGRKPRASALKVMYLCPLGELGGAERALLDLMAALRAANPQWRLALIAASDGELVTRAREMGVAASVIPLPPVIAALGDAGAGGPAGRQTRLRKVTGSLVKALPAMVLYAQNLKHAIAEAAPDLVHTNGFKMHLLGVLCRPRHVPVLWHIHDFVQARPMMRRLLRMHSRRCAAVVANSRSVAADARVALGKTARIFTVYNAIDLERFCVNGPRLDLDKLAGMPPLGEGGVRVGLLATMARWKGHETFLRALSLVPENVPIRGYVVGGPLYHTRGSQYKLEELRAMAAQLGVADRVGFTGFVSDPAAAMRTLDIVVHASTEPEPFGLVIAEAMACGRAVVASADGGAAEIVSDGVDALTHALGDFQTLARIIAKLALDPELRLRLGRTAAVSAASRFTHERLAAEMTPIYREIVAVNAS